MLKSRNLMVVSVGCLESWFPRIGVRKENQSEEWFNVNDCYSRLDSSLKRSIG